MYILYWIELCASLTNSLPKDVYLEHVNVTLFGIKIFADIVKDLKRKSFWISAGPKSNDECLVRDRKWETHDDTRGRRPFEDGNRHWSYTTTSQGMPRATRNWKQGKILPLGPLQGPWPCQHFDLRLLPSKTVRV